MIIRIIQSNLSLESWSISSQETAHTHTKVIRLFLRKLSKRIKILKFDPFLTFQTFFYQKLALVAVHQYPYWEAPCRNRENVIKKFLRMNIYIYIYIYIYLFIYLLTVMYHCIIICIKQNNQTKSPCINTSFTVSNNKGQGS